MQLKEINLFFLFLPPLPKFSGNVTVSPYKGHVNGAMSRKRCQNQVK